jgi:hypothetical protein
MQTKLYLEEETGVIPTTTNTTLLHGSILWGQATTGRKGVTLVRTLTKDTFKKH